VINMESKGISQLARLDTADEHEPAAAGALLGALVGDPLRAIALLLADEDRFCMRLACRTMRDHAEPAVAPISRVAFLRTRSLAAYAWDELPGFVLPHKARMLALAATVACVAVLAELWYKRGCAAAATGVDSAQVCCEGAASRGQLEALIWLRERNCSWGPRVCMAAAGQGHLEVLRYAHEHGCPWDEDTCLQAARGGHLEVLRYAREHGCPWKGRTCSEAALGGHFEVLRYARKHGCPWTAFTCSEAAGPGHCAAELQMIQK
jgi:transposase